MRDLKWWAGYIAYRLRWNTYTIFIVERIRTQLEIAAINRRLRERTDEKRLKIAIKFFEMKSFKIKMESKNAMRVMSQVVADLSAKTGIPQWELRARIQRDFNIDI